MGLRPLIIAIEIFSQPGIARRNALCWFAVMHIVIEIWDDESNGRQRAVVAWGNPQSAGWMKFHRRAVRDVAKADPWDVLAGIDAGAGGSKSTCEPICRQALCVAFERKTFLDQLLAQIARRERVVGIIGSAWHLIGKAHILIAAGE